MKIEKHILDNLLKNKELVYLTIHLILPILIEQRKRVCEANTITQQLLML